MDRTTVTRVFSTLREMMEDRRLEPDNNALATMSTEDAVDLVLGEDGGTYPTIEVNPKLDIVFCPSGENTKVAQLVQHINDRDKDSAIIVTKDKLNTNFVKNMYKAVQNRVQVYHMRELLFNPYRHRLVPEHVVLDSREAGELVKQLGLKTNLELPIILRDDAIAKHLDIRAGSIVKVVRNSPTAGQHNVYRVCV